MITKSSWLIKTKETGTELKVKRCNAKSTWISEWNTVEACQCGVIGHIEIRLDKSVDVPLSVLSSKNYEVVGQKSELGQWEVKSQH